MYMKKVISKGKLIVFEGIDRSGKSSQITLLSKKLDSQGIKNEVISFPDRTTKIGSVLNDYLSRRNNDLPIQTIHLLFSANRWEHMNKIIELLESGVHVITDRYAFSGIAYSVGVKNLDFEWCKGPDTGLIEPDLVLYMDVLPQVAASRGNFGTEVYETVDKLERVVEVFNKFRSLPYWKPIEASSGVNVAHDQIYKIVEELLSRPDRIISYLKF